MRSPPPAYPLPHSPILHCNDRFSITDLTTETITHWDLITAVLSQPIRSLSALIDALETIAITLRGTAGTDYNFLRDCFTEYHYPSSTKFFTKTWPYLSTLATELPSLFPSPSAPVLTTQLDGRSEVILSRRHIACLVLHQFLCTLERPTWMPHDGSPDFSIWYSSQQPHPLAKSSSTPAPPPQKPCSPSNQPARPSSPPTRTSATAAPPPRKKSSSLHSPELCPANLLTPTLADAEVLVVRGARGVVSMKGYGRAARFAGFVADAADEEEWSERTVLFMDALELDHFDRDRVGVPDLLDGKLEREVRKAGTAFSAKSPQEDQLRGLEVVVTGLWGCRRFGGDRYVKTLVLWIAASMARVRLRLVVYGDEKFAEALRELVRAAQCRGWTVGQVVSVLEGLKPRDEEAGNAFEAVSEGLGTV